MDILIIIAGHTNSELKIKALLHNIKYFLELSTNIVVINSSEFRESNLEEKLPAAVKIEYIDNDKYICYGKFIYYLNTIDRAQYNNVILTNDSIIITRSLDDFKSLISPEIELVAMLDSHQIKYHYPDFLRVYNNTGIDKLLVHYESNKHLITNFWSCINFYEVNSSSLFDTVRILYKQQNKTPVNIHFNDYNLQKYLYKKTNYPIIKIKRLQKPYYGTKPYKIPEDFNPAEYKSINPDLLHLSDTSAKCHFLESGMKEGRCYKKNQYCKILPYFAKSIPELGLDFVLCSAK